MAEIDRAIEPYNIIQTKQDKLNDTDTGNNVRY